MKRRVFLVLMALELLTGWLWVENRTLQTDLITVTSETLPPSFDGLRIVVLADLHGQAFGKDQGRLLAAVAAAEPDIIVLDGDLLSDTADFPMAETLALGLTSLAPTYYVTGNHEWASGCARPLMTLLDNCGVTVLENTWVRLERDGDSILFAGVNDPNGPYDQRTPEELVSALRAAEGDGWLLVACHRNDRLDQWCDLGADLVLSGHGHGGVIRLPGLGGLLGTDRTLFPVFDAGLFGKNGTQMAVSRGLGSAGWVPRLGNRPQVLVVELNCKLS
jgi:hypothetical protein